MQIARPESSRKTGLPRISRPKIETDNKAIVEGSRFSNRAQYCFCGGSRSIIYEVVSALIVPRIPTSGSNWEIEIHDRDLGWMR